MCCPVFLPFQNREDAVKLHKNTEKVALLESFSNSDIKKKKRALQLLSQGIIISANIIYIRTLRETKN